MDSAITFSLESGSVSEVESDSGLARLEFVATASPVAFETPLVRDELVLPLVSCCLLTDSPPTWSSAFRLTPFVCGATFFTVFTGIWGFFLFTCEVSLPVGGVEGAEDKPVPLLLVLVLSLSRALFGGEDPSGEGLAGELPWRGRVELPDCEGGRVFEALAESLEVLLFVSLPPRVLTMVELGVNLPRSMSLVMFEVVGVCVC